MPLERKICRTCSVDLEAWSYASREVASWVEMLNCMRAVSGFASNFPSAPTKTVFGCAVRVGRSWAVAMEPIRTRNMSAAATFMRFLLEGCFIFGAKSRRPLSPVCGVSARVREDSGPNCKTKDKINGGGQKCPPHTERAWTASAGGPAGDDPGEVRLVCL